MPAEQEMNAAPVAAAAEQETFAPISDEQGREAAVILQEMILKMGIVANVEFNRTEDGAARLSVSSEDGGILIGRKGNTLSAMQYLINRIISNRDANETTERIVVDVEGYLDRRRESLEELARSLADRAKATGRSMRLKPMSPQERRIVHLALQGDEEVRTFSLGDSLFRSVVIAPAHERAEAAPARRDRPQGNFQRRGGRGGRRRIPRGGRPSRRDSDFDAGAVSD
jgi:spoIIIJ-associated protein